MVERISLDFAKGLKVSFSDRDAALKRFEEIAEKGTRLPIVIFGPEGCGKTALLKQVAVLLEDYGYKVIYVNPTENVVEKAIQTSYDIRDTVVEVLEELLSMYLGNFAKAVAHLGFAAVSRIAKKISKPKIAILIDDVFQVIGLEKSTIASYIKSALNLIEYPEASYENIVVVIATGEGISRNEIGRHTWSYIYTMWNMSKDGFKHLYSQIPGEKPCFEDV